MNDYVVIKLVSGEQLFARLLNETENGVVILNPINVRIISITNPKGEIVEKSVMSPFTQFTEDKQFVFNRKDIIFCKNLHHKMISFYRSFINQLMIEEEDLEKIEFQEEQEPEEKYSKFNYH